MADAQILTGFVFHIVLLVLSIVQYFATYVGRPAQSAKFELSLQ